MPHGTPDWGHIGPKSTTFGLDDLGEQAVRLGSPHLWDRRGDTILLDDFESGLGQCVREAPGVNAAVVLEGGHAWRGGFCAKLTTGDDAGDFARISYGHGLPVNSRIGLEFTFTLHEDTRYIRWDIIRQDPTTTYWASVGLNFPLNAVGYLTAGGVWVELAPGITLWASDVSWHTGKLGADWSTFQYVRFILNDREWPMPGLGLFPAPGAAFEATIWRVTHYTNVDANISAYVDNVIVTQNEP